ncbi:unnamed protein product [Ranitomeya imitator]|uniref:Uncharacterized protein n=1 Tax=Ranitomeya imitator TaxID=111125 RepID=A0ABN9M0P8_9NEOB|nr:unnamed protein product [Ranitomeya imitator]
MKHSSRQQVTFHQTPTAEKLEKNEGGDRRWNVIGLLDVFTPSKSFEEFNDVYLVTHLMGADLNNIVKCQKLTDDHVQFLIYQILRGLKVL